ncbi:MAG: hypothetical protein H7Z15_06760 [Rhizobacter sp.]|nr:hypothetical protein [Rhizobacter sp.]
MTIAPHTSSDSHRYAKTLETAKRTRWDIDRDVIRGRSFDFSHKFLPDGLSLADELPFLSADGRRFMSQVQGRTYANMFALVERFIGVKMLELSRHHWLGDQTALEAIVGLTGEELKHQELFRRIEALAAEQMPAGYVFVPDANEVAGFVLGKSTWAVLALTCDIEFFSLAHYRASIDAADDISALFKDVFLHHWKEESQHVVIDEMEWEREDRALASDAQRDAAVDDLIALVGGVDGIVQAQAQADASYFLRVSGMPPDGAQARQVSDTLLKAYRWQYIVSGAIEPRFQVVLGRLTNGEQLARIQAALAPLAYAVPRKMKEEAVAH